MEKKRNNFLDGFVIGAIIGSAAVFLLGTKKGREVLQVVKEEGRERFGKLDDIFSIYHEAMDEDEVEDDQKSPKLLEKAACSKEKSKSPLRRKLFKGLSKRKSS